jgi:hypothetical protein
MATIRERIKNNAFYEAYQLYMKEIKDPSHLYTMILKQTRIDSRIGNESKYGEVYCGTIVHNHNVKPISIKKIPLQMEDLLLLLKKEHEQKKVIFSIKTVWREIYILKLCTRLVKSKKSIHLPLTFFYVYSSMNTWNPQLIKNGPFLYSYNELAQEDLKSWCSKPRTHNEFISCFLQIFFGLYVLQYYYGFMHNDLHWGNILVFHIRKGGCWLYKINNEEYYIVNEGYLFVIWDFGMANLNNVLKGCNENVKSCQDFLKILNTPRWIMKHFPNVSIPTSISNLCIQIRSIEYKSMNDLLFQVISKFSKTRKTYILESFTI